MNLKKCTKCGELKELSEFHKKGKGYQGKCKVCRSEYDKQKRQEKHEYYKKHKDEEYKTCRCCGETKLLSEFVLGTNLCKQCKSEKSKQYRKDNHDRYLKTQRECREKNKDRDLKQRRKREGRFAGNYIYMIIDTTNTPAYIGKTINIFKRIDGRHMSGNVEATKELFLNNNVKEINYIEVSSIIENETELFYLESYLINKYNGYLNTVKGMKYDNISKERQEELINKVEELIKENGWVLYRSYEVNYSIV